LIIACVVVVVVVLSIVVVVVDVVVDVVVVSTAPSHGRHRTLFSPVFVTSWSSLGIKLKRRLPE